MDDADDFFDLDESFDESKGDFGGSDDQSQSHHSLGFEPRDIGPREGESSASSDYSQEHSRATPSCAFKGAVAQRLPGQLPNIVVLDLLEGTRRRLWDLYSHTLLVVEFYISKSTPRKTFPLVSLDA